TRTFNERAAGPTGLHADRPHRPSPSEVGVEEFAVHLMEASALGDVRAARDLIRISAARSRPSEPRLRLSDKGVHHAEGRDAGIRNLTLQQYACPTTGF